MLIGYRCRSLAVKCSIPAVSLREEGDADAAFSITTRVPASFAGGPPCGVLEQRYSLGPLELNTEVVLRTATALRTNRTLVTDGNGYQMMRREHRDFPNNTVARVSSGGRVRLPAERGGFRVRSQVNAVGRSAK